MIPTTWQRSWRVHLFFALLFITLIGYHPSIQKAVVAKCVLAFERECGVLFEAKNAALHVGLGSIAFDGISITKLGHPRPILMAQHGSLSFAPAQSLLCGKIILESSIVGMKIPVNRGLQSVLDVVDFFKALLATSSPYISIRGLSLSDISVGDVSASVSVQAGSEKTETISDVSIMHADLKFPVIKSFKSPVRIGKLIVGVPCEGGVRKVVGELYGRADKSFLLVREGDFVRAMVEYSPDKLLYRAVAPADDLIALSDGMFPGKNISEKYAPYRTFGRAQDLLLKCRGEYSPSQKAGNMEFASSHARSAEVSSLRGKVIHGQTQLLAHAQLSLREDLALSGRVFADWKKQSVRASFFNHAPVKTFFGNVLIPPRGFSLAMKTGTFNNILGKYSLKACDPEYEKKSIVSARGIFSVHDGQISSVGNVNKKTMYGLGSFDVGPRLKRFVVLDEKSVVEVDIKSQGELHEHVAGTFSKKFVRLMLPEGFRSIMSGDVGPLSFEINQGMMPSQLCGEISLGASNCCILGCSNPLISARGMFDLDFMLKAARVFDVEFVCSSGVISSKEMLLNWSPEGPSYVHVPVVVNDLFINKDKDFCAVLNGECSMDWIDGAKHRLDGAFVIKKSIINSFEFADSAPAQRGAALPYVASLGKKAPLAIDANISIKTLEPTIINTATLKTRAHVDVKVGGCVRGDGSLSPKLSGTVRLEGGVLDVLGRPLRIMKGSIDLLSNQSDNPIIDFLAYTNVKQYRIAIHGSGSFQQPNFVFESNPPLSQEQIIGLVLSGSEYADINQQLPGIFLQNIHKILTPGSQKADKNTLLAPLISSLRYVQLLPYQDNVSSEKTVKARLNIDLGPHLRALVHKDIFGKEAVALQVEYDVSDELNLRLLRQSSGQVGAEAEIRFKF